jgi:predicted nucleic acid-binding protein
MLLDTYAWVEFFIGSKSGKRVLRVIQENRCFTSIISLAEIVDWCLKNGLKEKAKKYVEIIERTSTILNITKEIAILAGEINQERKKKVKGWGMIDSMILATATFYKLKVLTGDSHFKDIDNVEILE